MQEKILNKTGKKQKDQEIMLYNIEKFLWSMKTCY